MARKTSDIALLLGSRSRSRSRGGFGRSLGKILDAIVGKPKGRRRDERNAKMVSAWALLIGVLLAFGGGFVVGGKFAGAGALNIKSNVEDRSAGRQGTPTEFLGEEDTTPLADRAFWVGAFLDMGAAEARQQAVDLARSLRQYGLQKCRAYEVALENGGVWSVVAYFDGEAEREATRSRLQGLPEGILAPMVEGQRKVTPQWPTIIPIR